MRFLRYPHGPVLSVATSNVLDMDLSPLEALDALEAATETALAVLGKGLWRLPEPEVERVLARMQALESRHAALRLKVVREVDTRGVPATHGAPSLKSYLIQTLRMSPALAGETARVSDSLATRHSATGEALAEARVSYEQAKAISELIDGLPKIATFEQKDRAEAFLLTQAAKLDARDLKRLAKTIDAYIDPDGTPDREEAARSKRGAHLKDHHDGTQTLSWTDTDEHIAIAKAAIEALAAPVPAEDGEHDPRPAPVRRADALLDLCRRALQAGELGTSRGVRPHLHVTFSAETLLGRPGAPHGTTATGEHLSPATIERLSCDADITGILLDGEGVPLKLGRTVRTVTAGQWAALLARDTGCCFPGCTRPASWCHAHHLVHWTKHGPTDLDNLGLFCTIHHHYLHDKGWNACLGPDGHIEVIPPPWVDVQQRPRRNMHWHLQREMTRLQQ